jgi:hypothetical protein
MLGWDFARPTTDAARQELARAAEFRRSDRRRGGGQRVFFGVTRDRITDTGALIPESVTYELAGRGPVDRSARASSAVRGLGGRRARRGVALRGRSPGASGPVHAVPRRRRRDRELGPDRMAALVPRPRSGARAERLAADGTSIAVRGDRRRRGVVGVGRPVRAFGKGAGVSRPAAPLGPRDRRRPRRHTGGAVLGDVPGAGATNRERAGAARRASRSTGPSPSRSSRPLDGDRLVVDLGATNGGGRIVFPTESLK